MINQKGLAPIIIALIILILFAGGVLGYRYWKISSEEAKLPEELPPKEITKLYPRSSELFETCLKSYYPEEELEMWQGILDVVSDEEVEKVLIEELGIIPKDFEESLEKGLGETSKEVSFICRNVLMDEKLRSSEYNEVCRVNPTCCELPEPKDVESAGKLTKKIAECQSGKTFKIGEAKKLKYGYLITQGEAPAEFGLSYYLTDSGCLTHCYIPLTFMLSIKEPKIEERTKELETRKFEELPEEIKTKVKEFEEKIESLKERAASDKNVELCEEIKKVVEEVAQAAREEKFNWQYEAMKRKSDWEYENNYYEPCIKELAIKLNEESLCNRITSYKQKGCKKEVFLNNTDLCREITQMDEKEECVKKIALETNDIALCKKINDQSCQDALAMKLNKPEECVWGECFQTLAIQNNNVELCKRAINEGECIFKIAINTDNLELCKNISSDYEQQNCYTEFAIQNNDVELCRKTGNGIHRCIKKVAEGTNNPELCKMLSSFRSSVTECYTQFNLTPPTDLLWPPSPVYLFGPNVTREGIPVPPIKIEVRWTNPEISNLEMIRIYRSIQEGELGSCIYEGLGDPLEGVCKSDICVHRTYNDYNISRGKRYYYTVRSVDTSGNESQNIDQNPFEIP